MRGRRPKTVEEKKRAGNPGHRKLPEGPVKVKGEFVELLPPDDLPADGRELWDEVVEALRSVGIVDGIDRPALELMCVQFARARQARRVIASEGWFALGSTGQIVEHPALAAERAAAALWIRFAESYALTAAGRARLGLAALKARSLADELKAALEADDDDPLELEAEAEELSDEPADADSPL